MRDRLKINIFSLAYGFIDTNLSFRATVAHLQNLFDFVDFQSIPHTFVFDQVEQTFKHTYKYKNQPKTAFPAS